METLTKSCLSELLIFSTIDQNHFLNLSNFSAPAPENNKDQS